MNLSENYYSWIKWEQERQEKMGNLFYPLTGGQWKFAEWLFTEYQNIPMGNANQIFESVQYYIKHSGRFKPPVKKKKWWQLWKYIK